jgi:GT2 family glycosyltransferase
MDMKKVTIIIVGYNSWHYLQENLASLEFLKEDKDVEILYVDNGSTDETISAIEYSYPNVRMICCMDNNGVAAAKNIGIVNALPSEYLLFLDSDTVFNQSAYEAMIAYMDENPDVGLCSCKLRGQSGEIQQSCRRFPRIRHIVKAYIHDVSLRCNMELFKKDYQATIYDMNQTEPFEVDYTIGACHLIRRTAQIAVGFWDEKFFFGLDDADFCFRMKREGYKVVCIPQVCIQHAYEYNTTTTQKFFSMQTWKKICGFCHYFKKVRLKKYAAIKHKIHLPLRKKS